MEIIRLTKVKIAQLVHWMPNAEKVKSVKLANVFYYVGMGLPIPEKTVVRVRWMCAARATKSAWVM